MVTTEHIGGKETMFVNDARDNPVCLIRPQLAFASIRRRRTRTDIVFDSGQAHISRWKEVDNKYVPKGNEVTVSVGFVRDCDNGKRCRIDPIKRQLEIKTTDCMTKIIFDNDGATVKKSTAENKA